MNESRTPSGLSWPVILCWVIVLLDGFDLVVLGAVIPTLIQTQDLGFNPASATVVSTVGLVGVGIGAMLIGPLADTYGRRGAAIMSVLVFSLCTIGIAFAPSLTVFAALRFVAGLGLGACLPTALAYISEFTPAKRNGRAVTITMTGYHAGAVLTALLAIAVVPNWRLMFIIGGVAGLVVVPFIWAKLPESVSFVATRDARRAAREAVRTGKTTDTAAVPTVTIAHLLRRPYLGMTLSIWAASFMGLLLVYGLNTWLPTLMKEAGYDLGNALAFLLVLNLGAVAGLILAGNVADRRGTRRVALVWFLLAAVFLAVLSIRMDSIFVLYLAVFITGVFVFSAQVLIYALVSQRYPVAIRGTALGFSAGIGRIGAIVGPAITGTLVTAGIAYPWGFYTFAAAAVIGLLALLFVPVKPVGEAAEPAASDDKAAVAAS